MPGSWGYFRTDIYEYLTSNFSRENSVLDVGCGQGDYYELFKDYFNKIDCVEIWEPYIEKFKLTKKYNNVFLDNILNFDFNYYDIIIMGDILEHLSKEDGIILMERIINKCKEIIVVIPYNLPQEIYENNQYEIHLQTDLNDEIMKERYPMLKLLNLNGKEMKLKIEVGDEIYYYCVFIKNQ